MVQIHHLNCVEIQSSVNGRGIGHCLLLQTTNRLILIDTGIGLKDTQKPIERIGQELIDIVGLQFNEKWTALKQIEKLGLNPKDVTDCIISHLDFDHIGGLADFPNARVHIGREEYENFKRGNPRYLVQPLNHNPVIKTYAHTSEIWFNFEARKVAIDPETETYLIPLFGHTLGHCGIALKQQSKWLFYVGDAYFLKDELNDLSHPVNELVIMRADNNELRIETLNKIRKFICENPDIKVFGYHDIEEFNNFIIGHG